MLRMATIALGATGLLLLAACKGEKQDPAVQKVAARAVLSSVLQAAARKDPKAAEPLLGVTEFLSIHTQGKPKQIKDMTPQERAEAFNACFNQFVSCTETIALPDAAAIDAAVAQGTMQIHLKMKRAEATFQGLTLEKKRPLGYKVTLALYYDGNWRAVSCEPDLGR